MSFTDGKPWTATEKDCKAHWGGGGPGEEFRCGLCGYRFEVGDRVRWQYTNNIPEAAGNPLVCETCDTSPEEVIAQWKEMHRVARTKYWWFIKSLG